ncbi:hypothetical protein FRZ67_05315 [Panacibacter ginsenosidivorans]|uniref:Uncharacterized protein n=1 Tax=Panacibacter ginsenosidivorans TaxID=1813871 RepID=A0A5B8V6C3_9BACT|nr:hypothetical protein [Panacibacter ginsenosidivorans]QEC66749.1 hypothetical protein FRZ67_05315 [Panacibacter ginsenosidivorans]
MSKKNVPDSERIFENVIFKYYQPASNFIKERLKQAKKVYPEILQQEQNIQDTLTISCAYRILISLDDESIKPLIPADSKYPFAGITDVKNLLKLIHPGFLVPFLIYCVIAYELAGKVEATPNDILSIFFQITLPIRFKGQKEYAWYIQRTKVLSVNERNEVISHINTYHFEREFIPLEETEYRLIQASVLKDEFLHETFQDEIAKQMKLYYEHEVFQKQHWDILKSYIHTENKLKYTQSTIYAYNKDILSLMKLHTGYAFGSVKSVVAYLQKIKVF